MGNENSTHRSSGRLPGAYAPHLPGVSPPTLVKRGRNVKLAIPRGVRGGSFFKANLRDGTTHQVRVPAGKKPGDEMILELGPDISKIYASTLPQIPGMEIVQSKPIIWGSVSFAFRANAGTSGQQEMGVKVGKLMQEAQTEILQQAIQIDCNAVLGMTFNVTNDSSGDRGHSKMVVVTACGTPCSVVPTVTAPVVEVDVVQPLYSSASH